MALCVRRSRTAAELLSGISESLRNRGVPERARLAAEEEGGPLLDRFHCRPSAHHRMRSRTPRSSRVRSRENFDTYRADELNRVTLADSGGLRLVAGRGPECASRGGCMNTCRPSPAISGAGGPEPRSSSARYTSAYGAARTRRFPRHRVDATPLTKAGPALHRGAITPGRGSPDETMCARRRR